MPSLVKTAHIDASADTLIRDMGHTPVSAFHALRSNFPTVDRDRLAERTAASFLAARMGLARSEYGAHLTC